MKKKTGLTIIALSIIFMLSGITYAWLTWNSSSNTNIVVNVGGATISYEAGADITNNNLLPTSTKEKGITKTITMSSTSKVYLNLYLDINTLPDGFKNQSFKFELVNGNTSVKTGNFITNNSGDSIRLLKNNEVNSVSQTYKLYIWIDGNMSNPNSMTNQVFSFTLRAEATEQEPLSITIGNSKLLVNTESPDFSSVSTTDEGVYSASDDYGTSYYFRGAVTNNYVKFAGFYWRIIRINGNGTIRMIYDGTSAHANGESSVDRRIGNSVINTAYIANAFVGYMYGNSGTATYAETHANTTDSALKVTIDSWYKTNIEDKGYGGKVADTVYCNDRSLVKGTGTGTKNYDTKYAAASSDRYKNPNLTCPKMNDSFTVNDTIHGNGALTYPIGLITLDEVAVAGGKSIQNNNLYYLYIGQNYWTMSPERFSSGRAYVYSVSTIGSYGGDVVNNAYGVRPVISLKSDTMFSGSGTMSDPFVVV